MAFSCPICSCINFKDVVVPRGEGYYRTAFFECCGCSAMFRDPVKFSVDQPFAARLCESELGNIFVNERVVIRRACPDDYSSIATLLNLCFADEPSPSGAYTEQTIFDLAGGANALFV
jgi:hypothetical protein